MNNNKKITKAITTAGLFAAIYAILTVISVYFFSFLSVIGLLVLPIFAAYYASLYSIKNVIVFNIATMVICFFVGISEPYYVFLYVLPTLIVGDIYGLLNKIKTPFYLTIFLQTLTYCLTNMLALFLGEKLLGTDIVRFLIPDQNIYENYSLVILYIVSLAESIFSTMFINEKMESVGIKKEVETKIYHYIYLVDIIIFIFSIILYFFNNNFYNLFLLMLCIVSLFIGVLEISKLKCYKLTLITYAITFTIVNLLLAANGLSNICILAMCVPFVMFSLVKLILSFYNKK